MRSMTCPECQARGSTPCPRPSRVGGKTLVERCAAGGSQPASLQSLAGDRPTEHRGSLCRRRTLDLDAVAALIAEELLKEIRGRLDVPDRRRPALPDARPLGADALRRRGAADPPGQPGRRGAGGRALYPRRAVDRPAPARQRPAARDPPPARAAGQHRGRRRARRRHDARGRPPRRLRPGARRQGGRGRRRGDDRRPGASRRRA